MNPLTLRHCETAGLANLDLDGSRIDHSKPYRCQLRLPVARAEMFAVGGEYFLREPWATAVELDVLEPSEIMPGMPMWWPADGSQTGAEAPPEAQGKPRRPSDLTQSLARVCFRVSGLRRCLFSAAMSPFDAVREGVSIGSMPYSMREAWNRCHPKGPAAEDDPEVAIVSVVRLKGGAW